MTEAWAVGTATSCPKAGSAASPLEEQHAHELGPGTAAEGRPEDESLPDTKALRPLTSLKWPYIPEETSYADPLKRDDPKPLRLQDYEAIGALPLPKARGKASISFFPLCLTSKLPRGPLSIILKPYTARPAPRVG